MRVSRRAIIRAVVAALLLPVLLNILPAFPASAATALERDIAASICGRDTQQPLQGGARHAGHDHCILAGAACSVCAPSGADVAPAFAAAPLQVDTVAPFSRAILPPCLPKAAFKGSPPRGPPSIS